MPPPLTILITGAASGIGAATARRLARPGVNLFLTARGADEPARDRLAGVAEICRTSGAAVEIVPIDLALADAGEALVTAAVQTFGGLDQIVSNAGFARQSGVLDTKRSDLAHSVDVIAAAFLDLVRHGAPHLARSPRSSVVAVSSFVAHRFESARPFTPSAAAKAALEALVRSAAAELGPKGVTVNAVAPGYTRKDRDRGSALDPAAWAQATETIPLRRLAEPDDIASVIAFLLGPDARYLTGQVIAVDGGLTLS